MKITEALAAVSRIYVPGVVAYYGKQNPDPWMDIHDKFERVISTQDQDLIEIASERFVNAASDLIEKFKHQGAKAASLSDAVNLGENRYREHMSTKRKHCYYCEGKELLKITQSPRDPMVVMIVCETCLKTKHRETA